MNEDKMGHFWDTL